MADNREDGKHCANPETGGSACAGCSGPDGYYKHETDCGDTVEFAVTLADGVVDVDFNMRGCNMTAICVKAAVLLARGKTIAEARRAATADGIEAALEGKLPPENRHTAEFVAEALGEALIAAVRSTREPWRKMYGKRF